MKRVSAFIYGLACYVIFLATFLYAVAFIANIYVPKTIDSGMSGPSAISVFIDLLLLGVFGVQHSLMARPGFKKWWTKIIPKSVERSTYVLFASLALILVYWQWQPLPDLVWNVESESGRMALWILSGLGWFIVLTGTYMISHWHLFGLKQVTENLKGQEPSPPKFMTPGYYQYVRHPLMLGFIIAFWATPTMSVGHLLFAGASTGYILIALQFEEHDLLQVFGERYRRYKDRVPGLIPIRFNSKNPKIDEARIED